MGDHEKEGEPALPSPNEVIETLDKITSEAQTLRAKITDAVQSSMDGPRLAATDDPVKEREKTRRRQRKKR